MSEKQVKPYKKGRVILDKKYSMIVYVVTLILAVVCRIFQLKDNMNFETGKYIDSNPFNNYPLAVIVIGFVLMALILFMGESRDKVVDSCILLNPMRIKADKLTKKVSPVAAASCLLMGGFLAYESLVKLTAIILRNQELSTNENPVPMFDGISGMAGIDYALKIILMITFFVAAINIFNGAGITPGNCFFFTLFPIWKLFRIFMMINEYQLIGPYSEKCYILFTDIFSGMFFLYMVRFFAGFEKKNTRILMILYSYMASIVAAVSVIPRYAMYVMISYNVREGMLAPDMSDIAIVFLTVSISAVFWSNYVYRSMPKLNIAGRRRWAGIQVESADYNSMKSIDEK